MKFELTEANNEAGLAVLKITEGEFNGVEFAFKTVQRGDRVATLMNYQILEEQIQHNEQQSQSDKSNP